MQMSFQRRIPYIFLMLICFFPAQLIAEMDCVDLGQGFEQPAHKAITEDLFRGNLIEGSPFSADNNAQEVFKVKFHNQANDSYRKAIFKPQRPGDSGGFARAPMEYVAYWMNRALGMDYVPPTVFRKWIEINGEMMDGAAMFFVPPEAGRSGHRKLPDLKDQMSNQEFKDLLGLSKEAVFSDSRVLNVILQNRDAHVNNLLVGQHWVDGKTRPVFIDFGASRNPNPGGPIMMNDYMVYRNSDPVFHVRRQTFERLKSLNHEKMQEVAEFMNEGERNHTLEIRDGIVQYYEGLIRERGEQNVVIED